MYFPISEILWVRRSGVGPNILLIFPRIALLGIGILCVLDIGRFLKNIENFEMLNCILNRWFCELKTISQSEQFMMNSSFVEKTSPICSEGGCFRSQELGEVCRRLWREWCKPDREFWNFWKIRKCKISKHDFANWWSPEARTFTSGTARESSIDWYHNCKFDFFRGSDGEGWELRRFSGPSMSPAAKSSWSPTISPRIGKLTNFCTICLLIHL